MSDASAGLTGLTGWLQQHANWPGFFDFFSDIAGPVGWWVLLQLVVLWLGTRRGLRLAWVLCVAVTTNTLLKWLWAEPRPYWVDSSVNPLRATPGFGMPSGHAQGATALWLGLWLLVRGRTLLAVVLIFILFTGLSRIYYGVHSTSQVVVGCSLGVVLSLLIWKLLPGIEARLREATITARSVFALGAIALTGIVSWLVFSYRRDFIAPTEWLNRFEAAQQRFGEVGPIGLVDGGALVLVALLAGYALVALVASERGHRVLATAGARLTAILTAVVINVAALAALRALQADIWWTGVWLCLQPMLAIWLPLYWFGQPDIDDGAWG